MLSHLSLFTGIGGIDLAAEWAGFHTVGQCEINPYCNMVLEKRFPNVKRWTDVKKLNGHEIINTIGIPTLISGGFPCQPHSAAGKRKASGDDRDLWPELRRILCEVKPRWFVAENVAGLRSSEKGEFFGKILNDLASMGYRVGWGSWEAAHLNAPHHRERLFIVAHSVVNDNRPRSGTIPEESGVPENNREALHSRMPIGTDCNNNAEDTLCQRRRGGSNGDSPGCECSLQIEGPDCNASNSNHNGSGACGHGDDRGGKACCQERGGEPLGESCRQDTDVADTQQGKLAQRLHVPGDGWFQEHIKEQWRDSWYEVATCFCGVDDGVSSKLDEGIKNDNGSNTKSESTEYPIRREALRRMWWDNTNSKASQDRGFGGCEDIVPEMPYFFTYEIRDLGKRIEADEELSYLWNSVLSHPFEEECDLFETLLIRIGEKECIQKVEQKRGVNNRTKRLQCLGNAVVPQQVYPLLKEIADYEKL